MEKKTMFDYTLFCTEAQTRKALELGAPIDFEQFAWNNGFVCTYPKNPTAEQMIGWLEEQGIAIDLHTYFSADDSKIHHYQYTVTDLLRVFNGEYSSRKEATLAAIDAALEYLSNKKEK